MVAVIAKAIAPVDAGMMVLLRTCRIVALEVLGHGHLAIHQMGTEYAEELVPHGMNSHQSRPIPAWRCPLFQTSVLQLEGHERKLRDWKHLPDK